MTRAEMRARVRYFIDEPTQQNFSDSDINAALNIAQQQVQLEIVQANEDYFIDPSPQTVTLVPGTASYALHADGNGECDVLSVKRVEDGLTGLSIEPIDQNEKAILGQPFPVLISPSPFNFYILGNYLVLDPMPQLASTVKYWFTPNLSDMSSDSDRSQIPRALHDMIPVRAAIDAFIKDEADTSALRMLWSEYMDRLHRVARHRQIMAPKHVRRANVGSTSL